MCEQSDPSKSERLLSNIVIVSTFKYERAGRLIRNSSNDRSPSETRNVTLNKTSGPDESLKTVLGDIHVHENENS